MMQELDSISVWGFRSIASIDKLSLRPINVIIGPNGAGKSNFIGVFSFLHAIREGRLREYVIKAGGADRLLHFGSKTSPKMIIDISFAGGQNRYRIDLRSAETDELIPESEMVFYWDQQRFPSGPFGQALPRTGNEAAIANGTTSGIAEYIRRHLDRWRLYHFHDTSSTSPLKKTADLNDNRYFRADGANLASFLFLLRERYSVQYQLIRRTVQRVAPFFDDFILAPQQLNPDKIRLEWKHKSSDGYFDVSSLSDGTIRFIALTTLLLQPRELRPSVVLIDEPELGLHPYAVAMLAALVRQASESTQVVMSTQSPQLLDHFEPEDVLVAGLVGGGTQFTRLDPLALQGWLEDFSLGQLWEKNEIGGRPTAA